jgi:circadian clock protein KaiB
MTGPPDTRLRRFDDAIATHDDVRYELTLFVSGASDLSARAITNARQLCDAHLHGRYHLSVVDVHEDPATALSSQVVAAPTLMRNWPLPVRKLVGDLSHDDRVIRALGLPVTKHAPEASG